MFETLLPRSLTAEAHGKVVESLKTRREKMESGNILAAAPQPPALLLCVGLSTCTAVDCRV